MSFINECLISSFIHSSDFRQTTQHAYKVALYAFFKWCSEKKISRLKTVHVYAWKDYLTAHYKVTTACLYLVVTKRYIGWAINAGHCQKISMDIKSIRVGNASTKDALSEEDVRRLLHLLKNNYEHTQKSKKHTTESIVRTARDYALVLLMLSCGLRVSEASKLSISDVYKRSNKSVIAVHGKGRNGKTDEIPLSEYTDRIIRQYIYILQTYISSTQALFISVSPHNRGNALSPRSISKIVKKTLISIGLNSPRFTAHSLRHTTVTLSIIHGVKLHDVQQYARHTSVATTERYFHHRSILNNPCTDIIAKIVDDKRIIKSPSMNPHKLKLLPRFKQLLCSFGTFMSTKLTKSTHARHLRTKI